MSTLVDAWYWSKSDRIHHILPLHHVHGIINALTCALYVGATVEMHQKFDAVQVWERWLASAPPVSEDIEVHRTARPRLSVFMSVPTVYGNLRLFCWKRKQEYVLTAFQKKAKLVKQYEKFPEANHAAYSNACRQFRFMVSGSASLPTPRRDSWRRLSNGQVLLERYGMTGMDLVMSKVRWY